MGLPQIDSKTKQIKLGKRSLKIRPYTVAEERIILTAKLQQDRKSMMNAVIEVISACSGEDASLFTEAEIEKAFAEIYSVSVSDVVEPNLICQECGKTHATKIPISKLKFPEELCITKSVDAGTSEGKKVTILLKSPSIGDINECLEYDEDTDIRIIHRSLAGVYLGDEEMTGFDYEEFQAWFKSLRGVLASCLLFIRNQPTVEFSQKFRCMECGKDNEIGLKGFNAFFR